MTQLEFLQHQKVYCQKWLDTSEADLPGTMTHEKMYVLLEETEDQLIEFYGITLDQNKEWVGCYIDPEKDCYGLVI